MLRLLVTAVAALLLTAAPASAQAPVCTGVGDTTVGCTSGDDPVVGEPDVITDPADDVEPPASEPPSDPRAEQHVLGDSAEASSQPQHSDPAPAAAPTPVASAAAPASATSAPASPSRELPFTGVDAWLLALAGSLLLAAGLRLRSAA